MAIRFEVYRDGQRLGAFQPTAAYAVGPESTPVPGEVTFKDGLLTLGHSDASALGVSLLWEVGSLGVFQMETTRLPHREKPYILNAELARFRLMKIVQKQEDWSLFDYPRAEHFMQKFAQAEDLFADALGATDSAAASRLADTALLRAVELSEELAVFHADLLLGRRRSGNGFVKHIFGCRVNPGVQSQKYRELAISGFDYAVLPLPWKMLQPREGNFETAGIDPWIEALSRKRVPIIGGPLVNLTEQDLPDWLFIWENDFDTLRELAYEHVQRVVQRYRKGIALWNVVGGVCANSIYALSFEQMIELTRLLVSQVKTVLPNARTLITINQPSGEYHARNPSSVAPLLYAEMAAQAGINFDGFSLELHTGVPKPGMFVRDLFQLSVLLDRFSAIGRPVFITAVSAPGRATPDPADQSEGKLDPSAAGRWRRAWDPQLQADWMQAVYSLALSKPFVESIAWADLADLGPSVPAGGLYDDMFQPKPVLHRLQQLREKFPRKS